MHALTMTKMETLKQRGITIVDVKQVSQASKASKLKRLKCNIAIAPQFQPLAAIDSLHLYVLVTSRRFLN
jgi:hypothetical protein